VHGEAPVTKVRQRGAEVEDLRREWCVIALRVFLAQLAPGLSDGQRAYSDWRRGTGWPPHSAFNDYRGLTALRSEARQANAESRRRSGQSVDGATVARGQELTARFRPGQSENGPSPAAPPATPPRVKSVPFGEAVRKMLGGTTAEAMPPKQ
jgi:hypothetical protein